MIKAREKELMNQIQKEYNAVVTRLWNDPTSRRPSSYGTGFGPLAYNALCPWSFTVACGTKPVVFRMDSGEIDKQVKHGKAKHCVAFDYSRRG